MPALFNIVSNMFNGGIVLKVIIIISVNARIVILWLNHT